MEHRATLGTIAMLCWACGEPPRDPSFGSGSGAATTSSGSSGAAESTEAPAESDDDADSGGGETPSYDVGAGDDPGDVCKVGRDLDAVGECEDQSPPDSFDPDVQWSWAGDGELDQAVVTPLVANLTDDNGDGAIDLCDVPDIVVTGYGGGPENIVGKLVVLDGATGTPHFVIPDDVIAMVNPALGDIDGDGVAELVTARSSSDSGEELGHLVAYEHDGTLAWQGPDVVDTHQHAVALADLDADGDVEIMLAASVFDHQGTLLWTADAPAGSLQLTVAADLDDDGDLEVVMGTHAFHHDGSPYYALDYGAMGGGCFPQIADLDDDPQPEILLVCYSGLTLLEHDGTIAYQDMRPELAQMRPAAIHDVDGDDVPEIMVGATETYSVLDRDLGVRWSAPVYDGTGAAAGTAFDFLGDGAAEAMYADETQLFVFDDTGQPIFTAPRNSWTQVENPVVADVDNDGSAEIVVVSNRGLNDGTEPMVQVIRDADDRWIPARRIWNQHAYHVTNVREDGTIPAVQPKHWESLNTFRTQAQIGAGGVCRPAG